MRNLFSAEGSVMRALSELMTLLKLNLLTLVCSVPVVTAGAAYTAMHYCIMKMADGEDAHVAPMYFAQFKANLKSVTPAWLIVLGLSIFLYLDAKVFPAQGTGRLTVLLVIVYLAAFVLFAVCQWLFPLAARFENGVGAKFRNALLLAVAAFPRTLVMMAFTFVLTFIFLHSYRLLPLAFLFGLSFPAYLCSFFYYPVIKRQIEAADSNGEDS